MAGDHILAVSNDIDLLWLEQYSKNKYFHLIE